MADTGSPESCPMDRRHLLKVLMNMLSLLLFVSLDYFYASNSAFYGIYSIML